MQLLNNYTIKIYIIINYELVLEDIHFSIFAQLQQNDKKRNLLASHGNSNFSSKHLPF